MMMKSFSIVAGTASVLALSLAATAQADLLDIAFVERDGAAHVWIAFDQQPQSIAIEAGEGFVMDVTGVSLAQARHITPVQPGPVQAVALTPHPDGASLTMSGAFDHADAELREGGIWISLHGLDAGYTHHSVAEISTSPDRSHASQRHTEAAAHPASGSLTAEREGDQATAHNSNVTPPPAQVTRPSTELITDAQAASGSSVAPEDPGLCPDTASRLVDAPWDLNLLSLHADCLASLDELDNAAGLYERVLAFDPRHFQSALGLARIRAEQGQHDEAANLFEVAASAARTDGQAVQARMAARDARERAGNR